MSRYATYEWLKDQYLDVVGPFFDTEWNLLVGEDDVEYNAAMMAFSDLLIEAGWTWRAWFATAQRRIRILQAVAGA